MEQISYKIEVFEGPMDLLLHLISKHKLNINDIPILTLVEQYLDYVRTMQEQNFDVAGEFLEMAARLIYIKTVSLLPKHEEAETLKKELVGELTEYRDAKYVAKQLSACTEGFNRFTRLPQPGRVRYEYERFHEPDELLDAYVSAVGKAQRKLPPPIDSFRVIVQRTFVNVQTKVTTVLRKLKAGRRVPFLTLFQDSVSRSDMVATFLAVLELVKDKSVRIDGEMQNPSVILMREGDVPVDE